MERHNIPTAQYQSFTDFSAAESYIEGVNHNVVIKASGLAAGKGVIMTETKADAIQACREMLVDRSLGDAGSEVRTMESI